MPLLDTSNVTASQPTARTINGHDWNKSVPFIYRGNGGQLELSDMIAAFQSPKGMVFTRDDMTVTLPPTEDLLALFANMVNRPLIVGDVFTLNVTSANPGDNVIVESYDEGTAMNPVNNPVVVYNVSVYSMAQFNFIVMDSEGLWLSVPVMTN